MTNILKAVITGGCTSTASTAPAYQYDYGQILQIEGIDLPLSYQVHFSNSSEGGTSITMIGDADGVQIPDNLLTTGKDVYAFLFLHTGDSDGETEYKITIPVHKRPPITNEEPTPTQQSAIDQAIEALNSGVTLAQGYAENAQQSADDANTDAQQSEQSALNSEAWAVGERDGEPVAVTDETYQNNSKFYAEKAEQAASEGGWVQFYIDENGYLHYVKTPNVDLTFYIQDGNLYVTEGA